jgi:hypothetical protein
MKRAPQLIHDVKQRSKPWLRDARQIAERGAV